MVPPIVPEHKFVFIQTENQRCIVARFIQTAPYTFTIERAENWTKLEADARAAVEAQVGAITSDDHFPCPAALVERASWPP